MSDSESKPESAPEKPVPIWSVVANVVEERRSGEGGQEIKHGTRKFRAGQKVYLQDTFNGSIAVTVIGRYHGKHNYISCAVRTAYLRDFRPELVYSPTIIERIQYRYLPHDQRQPLTEEQIANYYMPLDGSDESRKQAESLAQELNKIAVRERETTAGKQASQSGLEDDLGKE